MLSSLSFDKDKLSLCMHLCVYYKFKKNCLLLSSLTVTAIEIFVVECNELVQFSDVLTLRLMRCLLLTRWCIVSGCKAIWPLGHGIILQCITKVYHWCQESTLRISIPLRLFCKITLSCRQKKNWQTAFSRIF